MWTWTSWIDFIAVIRSQPPGSINTVQERIVMCSVKGKVLVIYQRRKCYLFFVLFKLITDCSEVIMILDQYCVMYASLSWLGVVWCGVWRVSSRWQHISANVPKKVCSTFGGMWFSWELLHTFALIQPNYVEKWELLKHLWLVFMKSKNSTF